jgi:hypothetical protein
MQKLVNGKWVDTTEAELVDGDIWRIPIGGHINPQGDLVGNGWEQKTYYTPQPAGAPVNFVDMAEFGELLSDTVLIELEDLKKANGPSAGRGSAIRTLNRIYSNTRVDVLSIAFDTLLADLVENTSLTAEQVNDILAALA